MRDNQNVAQLVIHALQSAIDRHKTRFLNRIKGQVNPVLLHIRRRSFRAAQKISSISALRSQSDVHRRSRATSHVRRDFQRGAVVTNDSRIADAVRRLRDHGGLRKYEHDVVGYNSRLDAMQAAVLELKLAHLEERNAMRRQNAKTYSALLCGIEGIVTPFKPGHVESVYHLYVIRLERGSRDDLRSFLAAGNVQSSIHYPAPIHRTPAFERFNGQSHPVAERNSQQILSLPMYPELEREQIEYIASLIEEHASVGEREFTTR